MLRTHYSKDVFKEEEGKEVILMGSVKEKRDLGKVVFVVLRDMYSNLQVLFKKGELEEKYIEEIKKLPRESMIKVRGIVKHNDKAPNSVEILAKSLEIINEAESPLPIEISGQIETNLDKRIDWRFLDMRREEVRDVFIFESKLLGYLEEYLRKEEFVRLLFSRITGEATEGGAEYFPLLYYEREAFLAQSPQLYKESALLSGIDKVYDVGFVYRAEPHHTTRHLSEFMSFDIEMVTDNLQDILNTEEDMIRYAINKLREEDRELINKVGMDVSLPKTRFPVIKFREANKILESLGVEIEENDLTPEGERKIGDYVKEKYGSDFVFITHYPFEKKPFYLMREESDPSLTISFDLLFKGLEITSGGIREHRYEVRVKNMKEKGLDPEKFDHLRFWKYGMPPHGGLGLGIERLTEKFLGLNNVREATLLPRDPTRVNP